MLVRFTLPPRSLRACLSLAIVAAAAFSGCKKPNQFVPPPPPQVEVARALSDDVVDYLEFTGATRATATVSLRARVNGYLQKINFKDGAEVKKGTVLFVIEPAPYVTALASAKANRQKAQASLSLAEADLLRTVPLVKRGALSEAELDTKNANKSTAEADVAAAEAMVTQAELNLSYTQLVAPIDGRISRRLVDVGNLVQAETTILTTIESNDDIYAYFNVSESDVLRLMELHRAEPDAKPAAPPAAQQVQLSLLSNGEFPYEGTLDFSELGVDPGTGTQQRRAVFKNADRSLVPGLFVRLRLPIGSPKKSMLVAERAIARDQRGDYLLVVNAKNVVEYRPVHLGTAVGTMRVVADGVKPDEWIVVNGLQRARPGAPVDPQRQEQMAKQPGSTRLASVDKPAAAKPTAEKSGPSVALKPAAQHVD